jgi:hypothetical protein
MIRDASASYPHGHSPEPGPTIALADPLCVLEEAALGQPVGTRDPLLDDTRRLEKALAGLNVPCGARYDLGGLHVFHPWSGTPWLAGAGAARWRSSSATRGGPAFGIPRESPRTGSHLGGSGPGIPEG